MSGSADITGQLLKLSYNARIPSALLKNLGATVFENKDGLTTYAIGSGNPSYPHYLTVGEGKRLKFIKIHADPESQPKFKARLEKAGEPETAVGYSKSNIMLGFPSRGIAFTYDERRGTVNYLIRFKPKTKDEFLRTEAANYTDQRLLKSLQKDPNEINEVRSEEVPLGAITGVLIAAVMLAIVAVVLRRRKSGKKRKRK